MTYLQIAREANTIGGNTGREQSRNARVQWFNDTFEDALEYEQVRVTNDDSNTTNYDSWIYSNNSYKELVSMKTIIFAPGTPENIVFSGQYIRPQRQGGLFMLYSDDKQYEQKLKGLMDECTETLRRFNDDGVLVEIPVILRSRSSGSLDEDKYMILTDGSHHVGVPKTSETLKWDEGETFILANRHKYRIAWIDDVKSSTYMEFRLTKYEENLENDNLELGIADYENRPQFTINTNINTSQISSGNTVQLIATLLDKDGQVSNRPLSYSTSDANICTVDENGLITGVANGSCVITVGMTNNSGVTDSVNIEVLDVPVDNIVYRLDNDVRRITRQATEIYNAEKLNNGVIEAQDYTFSIVSQTIDNEHFEFVIVDNDTFSIKNNGGGVGSVEVMVNPNGDSGNSFNVEFELFNSFW